MNILYNKKANKFFKLIGYYVIDNEELHVGDYTSGREIHVVSIIIMIVAFSIICYEVYNLL